MADKILIKRSLTSGSVPSSSSLDVGELALNVVDKVLYTLSGSTVVSLNDTSNLATTASNIFVDSQTVTGSLEVTKHVKTNELKLNSGEDNLIITGSIKTGIFDATEEFLPYISAISYTGASIEYTAQRQQAIRSGIVLASWSGSEVTYTDVSNTDVGETWDLSFNLIRSGDDVRLRAYSLGSGSGNWTVQVVYKLFPNLL